MLVPFNPPPGLNSDDTTFAAEGRWADCSNVRFWNGKPQTVGPYVNFFPNEGAQIVDGIVRQIMTGASPEGIDWCVMASTVGVYVVQVFSAISMDAEVTLISDTAAIDNFSSRKWSLAQFGTDIIFNGYTSSPGADNSMYAASYNAGANQYDDATLITNAPAQAKAMLVSPSRQVMAFGCNEESSGDFNDMCIRWSDIEDYTDWTTTATNNAGEQILEGGDKIVTAKMVGPYIGVWTRGGLWLGQFIGDPGQTFQFEHVASGCGVDIEHPYDVTVVGQSAYWIGADRNFWVWTPGSLPQTIPCPISKDFKDNMASYANTSFAVHNQQFNEVWFFYCDLRDTSVNSYATRYVALSLKDGTWFRGALQRSAGFTNIWGGFVLTGVDANTDATFHTHEANNGGSNTSFLSWYIRSADQYFDESQTRVMIRRMIPDVEDQAGNVTLTLYSRPYPQGTETTHTAQTLAVGADKKDFRASGMIFSVKLAGTGGDGQASASYARLGKQLFDVVPLGQR